MKPAHLHPMSPHCPVKLLCGGLLLLLTTFAPKLAAQTPIAQLRYDIVGTQLRVTPATVSVPKGIPASVLVQIIDRSGYGAGSDSPLASGAVVEAVLRGPSFPARRIVGRPNEAIILPVLNLVGDYQLDNIRLIDTATGAVRLEGNPASVPVHVFDEVLISKVTSRPLTMQEITDKGIVVDQANFRAVEFEVAFVLDGKTIPVRFPVVAPDFRQTTEIIPAAELEARMKEAQRINDLLVGQVVDGGDFPPELQQPQLNLQIKGIGFQQAEGGEPESLRLGIPPIPALMVIPGNIGYLNQFFSVQIFTENGAPAGSGLSVHNVRAKMKLPPGPDGVSSTNYLAPGDDPLRFARVGTASTNRIYDELLLVGTGENKPERFYPGEGGQAEFLVEGLQEGLHVMDLDLTADLDGLAAGTVKIAGKASGSVLVRNPKFSLTFAHPRTIRSGEPYNAYVTVLNTSEVAANQLSITLRGASISGGLLESPETVQLGNVEPGQTVTAQYRIRAQRTGSIKFSNLTFGEDGIRGKFNLSMGIDERGVELSPDSIGYPDYVNFLPQYFMDAANRVLGQALSVATAPLLPPGVKPIGRSIITRRVLELAEAGQRLKLLDASNRVAVDLLLDWQGGRSFDRGFDQIIRETDAGFEFRTALTRFIEESETGDATQRLADHAPDIAGRSEAWVMASSSSSLLEAGGVGTFALTTATNSMVERVAPYPGQRGGWVVGRNSTNLFRWWARAAVGSADLCAIFINPNGTGQQWRWTVSAVPTGGCFTFDPANPEAGLVRDDDCDGVPEGSLSGTFAAVIERPPEVLTVMQDLEVGVSRPWPRCTPGPANSYGQVLAVLYSKPMVQTNANVPTAYRLDNGNVASGVQLQPGSRVVLLSMREGVSAIRPRTMTVSGVTDIRGNANTISARPVLTDFRDGVAVNARVLRADGSAAADVPVTVTMYDPYKDPFDRCNPTIITRTSQKYTDAEGFVTFDFVHGGVSFTVAAVDTGGLTVEAVTNLLGIGLSGDARFAAEKNAASIAASNVLQSLGVATVGEAMNFIEGLDRAVWSDTVDFNGGRMGQEIDVALRFRGRGVVAGQVLGPDGTTPEYLAAVNLFPDDNSRELVRGVLTTTEGRFEFRGVPLGLFTIQVQTSRGHFRTVSGNLSKPRETNEMTIVLTAPTTEEVVRSGLRGRVVEPDGITAVARARVVVYDGGPVALAESDADGFFTVTNLPLTAWFGPIPYFVRAVTQDGRRAGESSSVYLSAAGTAFATVTLKGTGVVMGRVELSTGQPATNALVAGGEAIVRTDSAGAFRLTGVPLGSASVNVGLEAQDAPGNLPRLGQASLAVLPGIDNFVVVRLPALGRIKGIVRDANGTPIVPSGQGNVAIPVAGGFLWSKVAPDGTFEFSGLAPDEYTVSAPAPPVEEKDGDLEQLLAGVAGGGSDEILAAMRSAVDVINRAQALRYGEIVPTAPGSLGFARTEVRFDGDEAFVEVRYLPEGSVSGIVINDNEVPIGAAVRLTGLKLDGTGMPVIGILGNRTSDPAEGTFSFARLPAGSWAVQAASPFYPTVIVQGGQTTREALSVSNLVMRFPPIRSTNGRLAGYVLMPGGTPAGSNVNVQISFGTDYIIRTDTNGFFDTQFNIPASSYTLEARDPVTGLRGQSQIAVTAGITNYGTVQLLGKGDLEVSVKQSDGRPAVEADVRINSSGYPNEAFSGRTDTNGVFHLGNVFEGRYQVFASQSVGATRLEARGNVGFTYGTTGRVGLTFGPVGIIRGFFRTLSAGQPIAAARVDVGSIGSTGTDSAGWFEVAGVGVGTYRVLARDPVSGRIGVATATVAFANQVVNVDLVELAQSDVNGVVFQAGESGPVAGAQVTLVQVNGLSPSRTVTTGPDGSFSFPAVMPGEVQITARSLDGSQSAGVSLLIPDSATTVSSELTLPRAKQPTGILTVQVVDADGVSPATNASVLVGDRSAITDENGRAQFELKYHDYSCIAASRIAGNTMSVGQTTAYLSELHTNVTATIRLSGVGRVRGIVLDSSGLNPRVGAEVRMRTRSTLAGRSSTAISDAQGRFEFGDLAVGPFELTAIADSLACAGGGTITNANQIVNVTLTLGPSGSVTGRIVRADGVTPVAGNLVAATYLAPSGLDGVASMNTAADGSFYLSGIPVGPLRIEALQLSTLGVIQLDTRLSANGQVLDLGTLALDEDWPAVVDVIPSPAAIGISGTSAVDLTFSELIATNSILRKGIFLSGPTSTIPTLITWGTVTNGGTLTIRLQPLAPLRSLTTYRITVFDGERQDGFGVLIGDGPRDLVGRSLLQPFASTFTTRDDDPPQLVSVFPTNGAVQIDPRSVPRFSFNEPVQVSDAVVSLIGPAGAVAGTVDVGFNGLVLSFTPLLPLPVNANFTLSVNGIRDLAGNLATNQPFVFNFRTLDTVGPSLALLRIADGKSPVRGAPIELEVALAAPESGVSIRFSRDLTTIGVISNGVTRLPVMLPGTGSVIYRAIATDRYGNEGPLAELQVAVVADEPPTIALTRAFPATGPLGNGDAFSVNVSATDDVSVTNVSLQGPFGELARLPNGAARVLNLTIPTNAVAGESFQLRARATDWIGQVSPEVAINLTVIDRTAPLVSIVSPAAGSLLNIATPLALAVASSDNSTNYQIEVRLSGPLTATQMLSVVTAANVTVTNVFTFPLTNIATSGATLTATARVFDAATNATTAVRNFIVPDTRAPQLTAVTPIDGSTNQSLWRNVVFDFDEALDPLSVNTNSVVATNNAGVVTPFAVALANGNRRVMVLPALPLRPATTYTNILLPNVTDLSSNRWQQIGGGNVPAGGAPFKFTTAQILVVAPTNGSEILLGQTVQANVSYQSGLGATYFRFLVNGVQAAQVAAGPTNTSATLVMPTNGTTAEITIRAANEVSFTAPYTLSAVVVNLLPLSSDRDGDGMTDTFEITYNLNPFVNDSAGDVDADGLANLQEFLAGTNPRNPDSDGDGISDKLDPAPLSPNHAPVTAVALITNLNGSITIALSGSDLDGDTLTSQLTSLPALGGVFLTSDGLTRGALVANVPTVVTGLPPRVIYVALGVAATNQIRYKVSDGFADSTNAILTFVSTNNPAADADGDGLPDLFELANNLNPLVNDAGLDPDADGLTNLREFQIGTLPRVADTDTDGLPDGVELVRGTNPLNPDTDGDGIPDGLDPSPLGVNVGMVFTGTNRVDLLEGQTTNLVLRLESTNGPIVLLDYATTNLPPAFVTVKSRTFSNTSSNGVATVELEFNPLHDAAGESVITLRAANRAGESITFDVRVVVADNPALGVTRWKDPVNGNWTDPARWDNGLPGLTNVALIDVPGTYTVNLNTAYTAAGIVLNSSNVVLQVTQYLTLDGPIEVRQGRFDINTTIAFRLNRPLVNRDRMRWVTRYSIVALNGTGRIENAGLWELFADPACPSCTSETYVQMPVNVPVGGKLLLSTNALVNFASSPSSLTVAGELEVQNGARLHFDGNDPTVRDLRLQAGSVLSGNGGVQLDGNCRLVTMSDLDTTVAVVVNSATARIVVPGIYTVRASQSFGGVIEASAVVVASNAVTTAGTVNFGGTLRVANGGSLQLTGGTVTFATNVLVGVGGRLDVPSTTTVVLSGTLTNQGVMRWVSAYNVFNLNGSGQVENLGLWEIYVDPIANYSSEPVVRVPVNVPVGGKLLLSTNAVVNFSAPSSLSVAGELEVQSGARLRVDASNPGRDVTLAAGSVLSGTGTLLLEGSSRLVALGDLDTTISIVQSGSGTRVVVGGVYRVRTSSSLSGTVEAPLMTVGSNVVLSANSAAFTGRLQVEDGGSLRLTGGTVTFATNVLVAVGARLDVPSTTTVVLSGTLTNQGVMRWVSAYNVFNLNGSGRVENLGLWEIYVDPIVNYSSEPVVRVPVNVPVGGKLLLSTNAVVNFSTPSSLSVAGQLEVQSGARLRLDSSNPGRDVTLAVGSVLSGSGTLLLEGSSRLVASGDLDTTMPIVQSGSGTRVVVGGVYRVRTSSSLSGTVEAPLMMVGSNVVLTANSAAFTGRLQVENGGSLRLTGGTVTFGTNVLVAVGARLDVPSTTTVVLSGTLTNQGVMRWVSAYNVFNLNGSGRVENLGLWEIYVDPIVNYSSEPVVRVPVNVPVGGKLLLSTNAVVNFSAPSSLSVAGELEVQSGARLRLDASTPARDLTLAAGSALYGTGTIQIEGSCRLVVPGDLDTTVAVVVNGAGAQLVVPGVYTVRTSRSISGVVGSTAVVVTTNAVLTASSASFSGPVTLENGSQLVMNGGSFTNQLSIEGGASVRLTGGTVRFGTNVLVAVGARLDVEKSTTVVLSGTLTNQGVMRWVSAYNVFDLNGSGRVENLGSWEIYADPIVNYGSEPVVRVPVNVPVGGKLLLSTNAVVNFSAPSSLSVAGELEVQSGARLRLDASTPARDLTLAAGSALYGTGTIQIEGSCRLVVPGDLDTTVAVVVNGAGAQLVVPGVYTVRTSRSISGVVESTAVVVTTNAVLTASSASFSGPVTLENGSQLVMNGGSFTNQLSIEGGASVRLTGGTVRFGTNVLVAVGARLDVEKSTTLVLSGTLTNQGVMRWVSAYNVFDLNGSGRVENLGSWEIYADPIVNYGSEPVVRVPVNVPVGGKLLLSTNAVVNFSAPSSLSVAGELEVQSGARLRLDGSTPARDLTLSAGSALYGTGTIQIEGSCRLVVPGDLDTTVAIVLNGAAARLVVPGVYTVRTSRTISGVVESTAVVVTTNAVLTASGASFSGPVTLENGSQLVMNGGSFTNQLSIGGGASVRLTGGTVTFGTNVLVAVGGRLDVERSTTLVLSGTLTNQGVMRWVSAYNMFNLNGSGQVENPGLWEVYWDQAATLVSESVVRVPVNVPVGGKLLLSTNAMVNFSAPSILSVAGELEVQSGARLRLDSSSPGRDATLAAGSVLSGSGTLLLEGSSRLVASGDLDTTMFIVQNGSGTRVVVGGVYRVRTSSSLSGTVEAPLITVGSNVVLTANSAAFTGRLQVEDGGSLRLTGGTVTFGTNVLVGVGGRLDVPTSTTVVLSGTLTNQGGMRWVSTYNAFDLNGSGRVENPGLWEVYSEANYVIESGVRVPVNVPVGGKLLLSTNAMVNFSAPSSLSVAGELEVQSGARLRLDGSAPARDLTLAAGSVLGGSGTLRFEGGNRLVLSADTALGIGLVEFLGSSGVVSANTLSIASNAAVRFDHSSTINGPIIVNGTLTLVNASATLRINARLTLNSGAKLDNSGTISVAAFVNNGGTIVGNIPIVVAGILAPLRIEQIQLSDPETPSPLGADGAGTPNRSLILKWYSAAGDQFRIESTTDVRTWTDLPAVIIEFSPGAFQVKLPAEGAGARFYRLRRL